MTTDNGYLSLRHPSLPERLRQLVPPPSGLWFAGDPGVVSRGVRVGIVGSRHPRADSQQHAAAIARDLAQLGFVIVSGLAIGVDGIAHRAALAAGGTTIGVLAGGLGLVHPVRHRGLAREIAGSRTATGVEAGEWPGARGMVLTEYGPGVEPSYPARFVERNRIIAALSDYLVVVQARPRSGSMSTVRVALDLGVQIGIVPSSPDDPCYGGSLDLVREGADCVVGGRSVCKRLEVHGVMARGFADAVAAGAVVDPDHRGAWLDPPDTGAVRVPSALDDHPLSSILDVPRGVEEIAELAGITRNEARRMLFELEGAGAVVSEMGVWRACSLG